MGVNFSSTLKQIITDEKLSALYQEQGRCRSKLDRLTQNNNTHGFALLTVDYFNTIDYKLICALLLFKVLTK